jgi:hypothetical protein
MVAADALKAKVAVFTSRILEERARADLYRVANDDLFVAEDVEVGA